MRRIQTRGTLWGTLIPVFLILASLFPLLSPSFAHSQDQTVTFRWAFGTLIDEGLTLRLEPIREDRSMKSGDHFKMMVEPRTRCFVYVIYHNSQGEMIRLFPYSLEQFPAGFELNKRYYIPQGERWFELDTHPGRETFYLLASARRLVELETLLKTYESADPEKKPDLTTQILAQIRTERLLHREFAESAERPVAIGGAIRGIEKAQGENRQSIDPIAEVISSTTGFYAKTFTIEHQ
ncbi:MAG TPA: DUF4384 domain-containing protein [Syntrophobacteraceae bacterium]|nr:DUF4384 domain-containing protein [Syntrophobacteraceae bacterium]